MAQDIVQSVVRLQYAENGNFSQTPLAMDVGSAYTYVNQFAHTQYDRSLNINPGPTPTLSLGLTSFANVDTIAVWNLSFSGLIAVTWQQTIIPQTQWTGSTGTFFASVQATPVQASTQPSIADTFTIVSALNGVTYTWLANSSVQPFAYVVGGNLLATQTNIINAINAQTATTGITAAAFNTFASQCSILIFGGLVTFNWTVNPLAIHITSTTPVTPFNTFPSGNIVGPRQCLLIPGGLLSGLNNTYGGINPATPLTVTGLTSSAVPARVAVIGGSTNP